MSQCAGYDLGATLGMQIRPPAPGSFQHPFGPPPNPMNPGLHSHHHQQLAAPMDMSTFLPQNGYEDANQGLHNLLRGGASPMDLGGIPQVSSLLRAAASQNCAVKGLTCPCSTSIATARHGQLQQLLKGASAR